MNFKKEKYTSADGSDTFYIPELNEYYHSHHGAIQEANHVFIKNGLHFFLEKDNLSILEVGFGTGLNALLSCLEAEKMSKKVEYFTLEPFPLNKNEILQLNYTEKVENSIANIIFEKIHQVSWNKYVEISSFFYLIKLNETIQEIELNPESFDIIYFDAFGPRVQPEMWTLEIFQKLYNLLKKQSCLVTYCAKGQVKRDLKSANFMVETLQGPPGKREMIRAIKY